MGWRSLARWFDRSRRDDGELDDELQLHLDLETADLVRQGIPEHEARRRARLAFGALERVRADVRDIRRARLERLGPIAVLITLNQASRTLRRVPWYAGTVTAVIALAVSLATAVFAIVDGPLFRPLPYRDADRLFAVNAFWSKAPVSMSLPSVSLEELSAWRAAVPDARFGIYYTGDSATVGPKEFVDAVRVDKDFLDLLGVRTRAGGFRQEDFEGPPLPPVRPALLLDRFWRQRFGADPGIVGRTLMGDGGSGIHVVGILPPNFVMPDPFMGAQVKIVTPLVLPKQIPHLPTLGRFLHVILRPPPAMTGPEATARLTAAAAQMAESWPSRPLPGNVSETVRIRSRPFDTVTLVPLRQALTSAVHATSSIVFWAAVVLALLACLNVTGLAAAHVEDRWRDLAMRRSLGAGVRDLVRVIAAEHLLLIIAGASVGVLVARPLMATTVQLMPDSMSLLNVPAIDGRVVGYTALMASACLAMITFVSTRAAWGASLPTALASGGSVAVGRRRVSIASVQVALALVMAVGGALVAGSLLRVWSESLGIQEQDTALVKLFTPRDASAPEIEELMQDVRDQKGVAAAGAMDRWLLQHAFNGSVFTQTRSASTVDARPESIAVTTGYLQASGLQPIQGRLHTTEELTTGASVIVVSALVAQQYWPGQEALGQSLSVEAPSTPTATRGRPPSGRTFVVIGVVPDVRYLALDSEPQGAIYYPLSAAEAPHTSTLLVQFNHDHHQLGELLTWLKGRCPACTVTGASMISDAEETSIRGRRFNAWLFSAFGVAAVVTVGVGILGLVAMNVVRRTREIGIRVALGATPMRVVRQIVGEQTKAVVFGLLAGSLFAAWAVRFIRAFLYKTPIYDPWSWIAAIAVLLSVALVAALLPSLRASRVDPVTALRME